MLGAPGETVETALETYELSYKLHPKHAWCSLVNLYPGTEIMEIAKQKKLIKEEYDFDNLEKSFFTSITFDLKDKKEIENLQKLFQLGTSLRIPKSIMKYLIKLPQNKLYDFIFKINYAIGIKRMDKISWKYILEVGRHYSKDFLRKRKTI